MIAAGGHIIGFWVPLRKNRIFVTCHKIFSQNFRSFKWKLRFWQPNLDLAELFFENFFETSSRSQFSSEWAEILWEDYVASNNNLIFLEQNSETKEHLNTETFGAKLRQHRLGKVFSLLVFIIKTVFGQKILGENFDEWC